MGNAVKCIQQNNQIVVIERSVLNRRYLERLLFILCMKVIIIYKVTKLRMPAREQGGRVPPLTEKIRKNKKIVQNREKEEKNLKKKGENWEVSFTLPLLTGRTGYVTVLAGTRFRCEF